jgi:cell division protein ZapE
LASDAAKSVSARLEAAVAEHRLEFDADQARAAERLDALAAGLRVPTGGHPARGHPARGILQELRSRVSWFPQGAERAAPRGLYLWGGVGRGKTLLMDAFHASLGLGSSEREHFYRFMRGVHAELAAIKGRTDPLDLAAARIAQRARVLCLDEFFVSDIADAMILAGLLQGLFRRGVVLVATSNTSPRDLYKEGLQRQRFVPAIELIEAHVEVLHLDVGIDYRLRQLERAPTYLDSQRAGDSARARATLRRARGRRRRARGHAADRGTAAACPRRRRGHRVVRLPRAVRRPAQPERLHRSGPALRHLVHHRRAAIHAGG